jgi:predicted signal transduction protein with EAL and GGDEF domain
MLYGLRAPCTIRGRSVSVSASIGLVWVEPFDSTPTIDELLTRADLAMYSVKRRGGGDDLLHAAGLQPEEVDEGALANTLGQALAHHEVTVFFQPSSICRPVRQTPWRRLRNGHQGVTPCPLGSSCASPSHAI